MTTRRQFMIGAGLAALGVHRLAQAQDQPSAPWPAEIVDPDEHGRRGPMVISTWRHGLAANAAAFPVLAAGGRAIDAVEIGVRVSEGDPAVTSVGYGGLPDREGKVTLDSCIMDENGNAGAVAFLQNIKHPISVARLVMDQTPHVLLAGEGARRFALAQGFAEEDLLTDQARKAWEEWLVDAEYKPWTPDSVTLPAGASHDTISMLALDEAGNLSGSCTTSGLAFKMHGRVGDSPIIGASLFVDNEVGAACATGVGEEVMKTVGSFLIVELMRQGLTPTEACHEAVARVVRKNANYPELQVGYLALDRHGRVGAFSIQPGFEYALQDGHENRLIRVPCWLK